MPKNKLEGDLPKSWSKFAHLPVCIVKKFPVCSISLVFPVVPALELEGSFTILYILGIFVRELLSCFAFYYFIIFVS